jgi:hypothetical protein
MCEEWQEAEAEIVTQLRREYYEDDNDGINSEPCDRDEIEVDFSGDVIPVNVQADDWAGEWILDKAQFHPAGYNIITGNYRRASYTLTYKYTHKYRFDRVGCSQCGESFGPGDHGYSHCENHADRKPIE